MKGDQKWEIAEITIGILFVCLFLLEICTGSFQVPPKKNHPHLQCQFPPKIPIWSKSLLYECCEKWLSPPASPPPITQGRGEGGGCKLWLTSFLFISAFSGEPSGFPDYTLSQEKVLADVLNKIWFVISFRGKLKIIGYLLSISNHQFNIDKCSI